MSRLCEGRICIVTGAGGGIGREHALLLAAHGARVVVNDLGGSVDGSGSSVGPAQAVVDEIVAAGGEAVANTDDVSDWDGAKRMVDQAIDVFGGLDVVVNNAGILRDRMLVNMEEAEWDAVIKVHLKGTFAPARHAAAYWRDRSKAGDEVNARIINTTSVSGIYGNPGQSNYGAAKMGIAGFTIIAAQELGPLRRDRQRDRPWRLHPDDPRPHGLQGRGRRARSSDRRARAAMDRSRSARGWRPPSPVSVTGRVFEASGQVAGGRRGLAPRPDRDADPRP